MKLGEGGLNLPPFDGESLAALAGADDALTVGTTLAVLAFHGRSPLGRYVRLPCKRMSCTFLTLFGTEKQVLLLWRPRPECSH